MCSENSNPLALMALIARGTVLHAMSWPNFWGKLILPQRHYVSIATYNFAQVAKCFVISACSVVNEDMIEKLQLSPEEKNFLLQPEYIGGSLIVGPDAKLLAGPMGNEEGIIYADIDIDECIKGKLTHDWAGHYVERAIISYAH